MNQWSTRSVRHTLLGVDLILSVQCHGKDENIGEDVASADEQQDLRILKGNLLGQLHHHQDDGEVGAAMVNFCNLALST